MFINILTAEYQISLVLVLLIEMFNLFNYIKVLLNGFDFGVKMSVSFNHAPLSIITPPPDKFFCNFHNVLLSIVENTVPPESARHFVDKPSGMQSSANHSILAP